MQRPIMPSVAQVKALPLLLKKVIPASYEDMNGHMNIQHYLGLYDEAGLPFFESFGITADYFAVERQGIFDLEHHLRYLAEVHVGDYVAIHSRLLARTPKRLHGMWFIVNETRQELSNTFEFISSHADLKARRTSPFSDDLAQKFDVQIANYTNLEWEAPICGVMHA